MNLNQIIENLEAYLFTLQISAPDVYTDELEDAIKELRVIATLEELRGAQRP